MLPGNIKHASLFSRLKFFSLREKNSNLENKEPCLIFPGNKYTFLPKGTFLPKIQVGKKIPFWKNKNSKMASKNRKSYLENGGSYEFLNAIFVLEILDQNRGFIPKIEKAISRTVRATSF